MPQLTVLILMNLELEKLTLKYLVLVERVATQSLGYLTKGLMEQTFTALTLTRFT